MEVRRSERERQRSFAYLISFAKALEILLDEAESIDQIP